MEADEAEIRKQQLEIERMERDLFEELQRSIEIGEPQFAGFDITKADQTLRGDSDPEEIIDEQTL